MKKIIKLSILVSVVCGAGVGYASEGLEDDKKPGGSASPVIVADHEGSQGGSSGSKAAVDERKDSPIGGPDIESPEMKPGDGKGPSKKDPGTTADQSGAASVGDKGNKKKKGCFGFSCFSAK